TYILAPVNVMKQTRSSKRLRETDSGSVNIIYTAAMNKIIPLVAIKKARQWMFLSTTNWGNFRFNSIHATTHNNNKLNTVAKAIPEIPNHGVNKSFNSHFTINAPKINSAVRCKNPNDCKIDITVMPSELSKIASAKIRKLVVPASSLNNNMLVSGKIITSPTIAPKA